MKLALATWSFPYCSLPEVVGISKVLGIPAVDMGIDYKASVGREALLSDPISTGTMVRALTVNVPCFYYRFGNDIDERNNANSLCLEANIADFKKIVSFCQAADIKTIFLLPGIVNPGQSLAEATLASAKAFNAFMPVALDAGITLTFEPHVGSITESPQATLALLEDVPELKLTLDYSHFVCLGYRQEDIDPLVPHAAHVHLRQAKPGEL
ncbi:MAG: TIM barrel protein, partial [Kordiimonadaceae bacterium]|nr:TIM barrel protein [Kordiimonadaceae bacterium]